MCEICRQSPCHSQCPNADPPPRVHTCSQCREDIVVGDEFVELDGGYYHLECLEDMTAKEIIELCGYSCKTAEEYVPDWDE